MAGRPKMMAKRARRFLEDFVAFGNRFHSVMPELYRSDSPATGVTCKVWREAANQIADTYTALQELTYHLNAKAGYKPPPPQVVEPEPVEPSPAEVTEDTVVNIDGDSATLKQWCEKYETPIELARQRVRDGMDWELAIILPVEDEFSAQAECQSG